MQSIIITPTNGLQNSLDFYQKLNFTTIEHDSMNLVTDGKIVIEINEKRFIRAGVKIFRESWTETVKKLEAKTKVIEIENGYLITDGNGVFIYLIEGKSAINIDLEKVELSTLGNSMGVSIEAFDMEKTIEIWSILGFSQVMGSVEQGWVVYGNEDGLGISFMKPNSCPHLFFSPSLTYFNGKNNMKVIENIRAVNIPIAEEITVFNKKGIVDNVILRDNGGLGFFIFSD
ncbi:MAG: hypothetical protein AB8G11_21205 [Saprospiraceae bacterium]